MHYLVNFFIFFSFLANVYASESVGKHINKKCNSPVQFYTALKSPSNLTQLFLGCPKLNEYIIQSKFDNVLLAFANPTLSTPMSYFGHNFLIFNKKESLSFSKVFSYSAVVNENDTFIELINKSIFGGLKGRYTFTNFYNIKYEYIEKEQRSLTLYKLNLTKREKNIILLKAYELYHDEGVYNFFNQNCTTELLSFLSDIKTELKTSYSNPIYVQPSQLINLLIQKKIITISPDILLSGISKLHASYYSKDISVQRDIDSFFNDPKPSNTEEISNAAKYDINLISNIKFKHENQLLSSYDLIKNMKFNHSQNDYTIEENIISRTPPHQLKFGVSFLPNTTLYKIAYKPTFITRKETKINDVYSGTLNLFNTELTFVGRSAYISKFDLIEIESFAKSFSQFNFSSWRFFIGSGKSFTPSGNLKWDADFAYGKTWGTGNLQVSVLPQLTYSFNSGLANIELFSDILWRTKFGNFNVNLIMKSTKNTKFNFEYQSQLFLSKYSFNFKYIRKYKLLEFNFNYRF